MKKKWIFILLFALAALCLTAIAHCFDYRDQPIDKIDLTNHKETIIKEGLPNLTIADSAVVQQAGSSYILYQLPPIQDENQRTTGLLYGFLRIRKDFNQYRIVQKQNFFYDMGLNLKYVTGGEFGNLSFGIFLNPNVYKIEFYNNQSLIATFVRSSEHNFYFIAIPDDAYPIDQEIYYSKENKILYISPGDHHLE